MQALLLSGDQLLSPHLPPSTAASSKGDAGGQSEGAQEKPLLSLVVFVVFFFNFPPVNACHRSHCEGEDCTLSPCPT